VFIVQLFNFSEGSKVFIIKHNIHITKKMGPIDNDILFSMVNKIKVIS
jgi:hypothetical protein